MTEIQITYPWQRQIDKVHTSLDAIRQLDVIRLVVSTSSKIIKTIDPEVVHTLDEIVGRSRCADLGINWAATINLAMNTPLLTLDMVGDDEFIILVDAGALMHKDQRPHLFAAFWQRVPVDVHVPLAQLMGYQPRRILEGSHESALAAVVHRLREPQESARDSTRPSWQLDWDERQQYLLRAHRLLELIFTDRRAQFTVGELISKTFEVGVRQDPLSGTELLITIKHAVDLQKSGPDVLSDVSSAIKSLLFGVLYPCGVCRSPAEDNGYDIEVDQKAFEATLEVLRAVFINDRHWMDLE